MNEDKDRPGVSGKNESKKSWFNVDKYHEQQDFIHHQEEAGLDKDQVLKTLKLSPEVDVKHIDISVDGGSVILRGEVEDPKESRAAENIIKNIPGVKKVVNELDVKKGEDLPHH